MRRGERLGIETRVFDGDGAESSAAGWEFGRRGGGVTTEAVGTGGGGVCCTGRVNPKGKRGRRAVRSLYREWPENRGDLIYSVIDHVDAKFRNCPWGSGVTAPCLVTDGRGP